MITRRVFATMFILLLANSLAFAGGNGGTKKDATIKVRNDSQSVAAAWVDPPKDLENQLGDAPTQQKIEATGGKIINPGATVSFKVKAGTYTLLVGQISEDDGFLQAVTQVSIGKGKTKSYAYKNNQINPL